MLLWAYLHDNSQRKGRYMIVVFQIIGLIALSIFALVMHGILLGIHTLNKRLDAVLFCAGILLIFTSVNALFFAGWIVVFNILGLHSTHTFQSGFQTLHFTIYFFVVVFFLVKPLSSLMLKSVNLIYELQRKLRSSLKK